MINMPILITKNSCLLNSVNFFFSHFILGEGWRINSRAQKRLVSVSFVVNVICVTALINRKPFVCFHAQTLAKNQSLSNVEPMIHTAKLMTVVEDEKELKDHKQIKKKTIMSKVATNRHDLKMALMKRGMSVAV